ncbi:cytidylyltransferase [Coprinopsis cinerea AmutBmut pab1-1]|nr:cytidylyltransferase [Coprinopsis cinerea AmutBmut pab1-1]
MSYEAQNSSAQSHNDNENAPGPITASDHEMLTHIRTHGPRLLQTLQESGASKELPFKLVWTAHPHWPLLPNRNTDRVRISVLDSSFNPPTLAHLALANSQKPGQEGEDGYEAKLLLLSVKNADKTLKPGDASYLQRLQMMGLLSQDVVTRWKVEDGRPNVAIGIIDEPTFVGKSRILKEYFAARLRSSPLQSSGPSTQLTFIVGMDTLERLFSPKYYPPPADNPDKTAEQTMLDVLSRMLSPPPDGDDSFIVCANRANLPSDTTQQAKGESGVDQTLSVAQRMGWMKEDPSDSRITLIDIGKRESRFSSTSVRNSRRRIGSWPGGEQGGGRWKDWVTSRVAAFIEKERLYLE